MFKSVRERGAVAIDDEPSTAPRGHGGAFTGVGYRLGQTADDHEEVPTAAENRPQDGVRSVRLKLYREGFTVDSGDLRLYSDQANAEFLNCIRRGEIPLELSRSVSASGGSAVRVSLEDRRGDSCPHPVKKENMFAGKGHVLGSPTPAVVGEEMPVERVEGASGLEAVGSGADASVAQEALSLDDSQPVTTIQFRLADGTRITGRFNHRHTVADLRRYILNAMPQYEQQSFVLMTTFPSEVLADPTLTLEQGKLLNSVVVQRVK